MQPTPDQFPGSGPRQSSQQDTKKVVLCHGKIAGVVMHLKKQERSSVAVAVTQQLQQPGLQLGHAASIRPKPGLLPGLGPQQGCDQRAALLQRLAALHQLLQLPAVACTRGHLLRGMVTVSCLVSSTK